MYPDGPPPGLWIDDFQDQPSEPDVPLPQGLKTRFTNKSGSGRKPIKNTNYPSAAALEAAAQNFPDLVPPSTDSLSADAPPEVLEAELKRLLGDWNRGLDVLGDLLTSVDDNNRGVASGSSGGDSKVAGGRGKATKKRGHGQGQGQAHGRPRGTGEWTDPGAGIENLSLGATDDFDFYPDADLTSATADENPDTAQQAALALSPAPED